MREFLRCSALLLFVSTFAVALPSGSADASAPSGSFADFRLPATVPGCACEADREALFAQRDRIASAPDVEEARALALEDTRNARRALGAARWMAPGSESIRSAHERLSVYEQDVNQAASPGEVAERFEGLVQLASLGSGAHVMSDVEIDLDDDVEVEADGGCDYSGGEVIAIVLGFIFGIIPGIILLVLLC